MTESKIKQLAVPESASSPQVMQILRDALAHARQNKMQGCFIVMVPEDIRKPAFLKAATPVTHQDIDILLVAIEEGHEIVWQLGN